MTEMKDVIAARRRALGFTQEQLAQKIGVSAKVVSKWETGRSLPCVLPAFRRKFGGRMRFGERLRRGGVF